MIHDVQVDRDNGTVRSVVVFFGQGNRVEINTTTDGKLHLTLTANGVKVRLDAKKTGCSFERALNILRLHLPCCRDAQG